MPASHEVQIISQGPSARLVLAGEIDLAAAPDVSVAADEVLTARPDAVIVDLSGATFLDSAGIGVLVGLSNRAADAKIVVQLQPGPPNVMRVLELVGLTETLEVVDGVAGADDHNSTTAVGGGEDNA